MQQKQSDNIYQDETVHFNSYPNQTKVSFFKGFLSHYKYTRWYQISIITLVLILVILCFIFFSTSHTSTESRPISLSFESIGELATQASYYTNVQVIEKDRKVFGIHVPGTQSKSIFSYDGIIKVGYNFSEITMTVDDVEKTIKVVLPDPIIIANTPNYDSLKIYDESQSAFAPIRLEDTNQALQDMAEESAETAISNGIYEDARANAEILITAMLASIADSQSYTIIFQ